MQAEGTNSPTTNAAPIANGDAAGEVERKPESSADKDKAAPEVAVEKNAEASSATAPEPAAAVAADGEVTGEMEVDMETAAREVEQERLSRSQDAVGGGERGGAIHTVAATLAEPSAPVEESKEGVQENPPPGVSVGGGANEDAAAKATALYFQSLIGQRSGSLAQ